jgi:hypothetical protein
MPEYRMYPTVRRYPVVLAFIARHVLKGAVEGARDGYRTTCSELGELVLPHAIDAALRDFRTEGRRMAATVRAVDLLERALRGELQHHDGRAGKALNDTAPELRPVISKFSASFPDTAQGIALNEKFVPWAATSGAGDLMAGGGATEPALELAPRIRTRLAADISGVTQRSSRRSAACG